MCEKKCFKCNEVKGLSEFYKHKQMSDGYLNKCKACAKKDTNSYAINNVEKVNGYKRKWAENNKQSKTDSNQKWRGNNPIKHVAHGKVSYAISAGKLTKPISCECCGVFTDSLHAHHCDYSKPLEVSWLCSLCHKDWHKNNDTIGG